MTEFLWVNLVNVLVLGSAAGQVVLPEHLHRSGLTQWEIGMIWAAFACAAILIRFKLGVWLARYGQLPFYRAGALVIALCETSYALVTPTAPLILVLRSLEGLAMASYFTAVWSRVIDTARPGQIGRTTGLFGISGLCAGAVGPWALEHIAMRWGFPATFACSGAAGLVGFLMCLRIGKEASTGSTAAPGRFWTIALARPMRSTVVTSWLFGMTLGVFNTFIVVYAVSMGLAPVGPMFLLYTVSSVLVRLKMGHLSDRWHPKLIILPSLTILCAATAVLGALPYIPYYAVMVLAGASVGSAHGMIYPAISNLALQRAGSGSNGASSVFTACMDFGNLIGCAAAGWVAHYEGHDMAFISVSVVLAGGALLVYVLERE